METRSSFQDHLKLSKDLVSKWPSWKRDVLGVVNKDKISGTSIRCKSDVSSTILTASNDEARVLKK